MPVKHPHRPLRLVHTSDVHLETDTFGSGERGVQLRDKVRTAFGRVIDIANERDADMLLIVGDLFDSARVTEEGLAFAFGTIARAQMPVVMIPGNHDAHDERSIYAGLAPGYVGLYQVNFTVPLGPQNGIAHCALPGSFAPGSNVPQSNLTVSIGGQFSFDGAGICVDTQIPVD